MQRRRSAEPFRRGLEDAGEIRRCKDELLKGKTCHSAIKSGLSEGRVDVEGQVETLDCLPGIASQEERDAPQSLTRSIGDRSAPGDIEMLKGARVLTPQDVIDAAIAGGGSVRAEGGAENEKDDGDADQRVQAAPRT